jgi:hypothetical protein
LIKLLKYFSLSLQHIYLLQITTAAAAVSQSARLVRLTAPLQLLPGTVAQPAKNGTAAAAAPLQLLPVTAATAALTQPAKISTAAAAGPLQLLPGTAALTQAAKISTGTGTAAPLQLLPGTAALTQPAKTGTAAAAAPLQLLPGTAALTQPDKTKPIKFSQKTKFIPIVPGISLGSRDYHTKWAVNKHTGE